MGGVQSERREWGGEGARGDRFREKLRSPGFDGPGSRRENPTFEGFGPFPHFVAEAARMTDFEHLPGATRGHLDSCLSRLAAGDSSARGDLLAFACERMRGIAHRMLGRFPTVRRWDETDDVVQNAAIRLHHTLGQITPRDARGFVGLMAVHIRRELLDLARKHAGPRGQGANHETNTFRCAERIRFKTDEAIDEVEPEVQLDRWTRLHETAESLPEEERELFHLVWYLGMKQDDIGTLLGCSIRTVKRRWESAKQRLAGAVLGNPMG